VIPAQRRAHLVELQIADGEPPVIGYRAHQTGGSYECHLVTLSRAGGVFRRQFWLPKLSLLVDDACSEWITAP
jgi:hypothetical protein